jgi:hypothetical protein
MSVGHAGGKEGLGVKRRLTGQRSDQLTAFDMFLVHPLQRAETLSPAVSGWWHCKSQQQKSKARTPVRVVVAKAVRNHCSTPRIDNQLSLLRHVQGSSRAVHQSSGPDSRHQPARSPAKPLHLAHRRPTGQPLVQGTARPDRQLSSLAPSK